MNKSALFVILSAALHIPLAALVIEPPTLLENAPLIIRFEDRKQERYEEPEKPKQVPPKTAQVKSAEPKVEASEPEEQRTVEEPRAPGAVQDAVPVPPGAPAEGSRSSDSADAGTVPSLMPPAPPTQAKVESPLPATRDIDTIRKDYFREVMRRIDQKKEYPSIAIRRNWEGKVGVVFTVKEDGSVGEVKIVRKSEYALLDEAAVEAVKRAQPLPPPPKELRPPLTLRLDIAFTLND